MWLEIRALLIFSRRFCGRLYAIMGGSGNVFLLDSLRRRMLLYLFLTSPGKSLRLGWNLIGKVTLRLFSRGLYLKVSLRGVLLTFWKAGFMCLALYPLALR